MEVTNNFYSPSMSNGSFPYKNNNDYSNKANNPLKIQISQPKEKNLNISLKQLRKEINELNNKIIELNGKSDEIIKNKNLGHFRSNSMNLQKIIPYQSDIVNDTKKILYNNVSVKESNYNNYLSNNENNSLKNYRYGNYNQLSVENVKSISNNYYNYYNTPNKRNKCAILKYSNYKDNRSNKSNKINYHNYITFSNKAEPKKIFDFQNNKQFNTNGNVSNKANNQRAMSQDNIFKNESLDVNKLIKENNYLLTENIETKQLIKIKARNKSKEKFKYKKCRFD